MPHDRDTLTLSSRGYDSRRPHLTGDGVALGQRQYFEGFSLNFVARKIKIMGLVVSKVRGETR